MAVQWKLLSEVPGYERAEGYRIGYDDILEGRGGFRLQSRRMRVYVKGREGASRGLSEEWHELKLCLGKAGYLQSTVYSEGWRKTVQVHQVGYLVFGPPRPSPDHWVLHRDDDKRRNTLENLYWGLPLHNSQDRLRNGRVRPAIGQALPQTKLTEDGAREIYRRAWQGENSRTLAVEFGISQPNVSMIKHKKSWRHIHSES